MRRVREADDAMGRARSLRKTSFKGGERGFAQGIARRTAGRSGEMAGNARPSGRSRRPFSARTRFLARGPSSLVFSVVVLLGCETERSATESPSTEIRFEDASMKSGLDFEYATGDPEKDYILSINGGGIALLDYDGDGRLDAFLANGGDPDRAPGDPQPSDGLYRNLGGLRFETVTRRAGLIDRASGCGVATADYDNDGDPDLFVANYGPDRLWRNNGDGTFVDATAEAGTGDPGWGASCAFFDFDRDGHLDLFVANYLAFDRESVPVRGRDPRCHYRGVPIACGPAGLPPEASTLYRNRGDGTFEDVSERAGLRALDLEHFAYSLGVAILDANGDDWLDIYVANDTRPNVLWLNEAGRTFRDVGSLAGVAYSDEGVAQAGMGVDAVYLGDSAREDLFVVNFSRDTATYYRSDGDGFFTETTTERGLARATYPTLGWGTFFFDADLDGDQDLFVANGHVAPQVDAVADGVSYRQANQVFANKDGRFRDVSAGSTLGVAKSSRGAAFGDLDGDGDADIIVSELDERATVLENTSDHSHHWLAVRLRGTVSNRDGIGAIVTLRAGGRTQRRRLRSGSSYASQSELVARFGLGRETKVDELRVDWPSGRRESFAVSRVDRSVELTEGTGRQLGDGSRR